MFETSLAVSNPAFRGLFRSRALVLTISVGGFLLPACDGCFTELPPDSGSPTDDDDIDNTHTSTIDDAGDNTAEVDGGSDAGEDEPLCDENTEGFGDPCAAQPGDPLCGNYFCCTDDNPSCSEGQLLFCYDLGPNECGGCDELDQSAGRIGESCGEFGCGTVVCSGDGTATECVGDHEPNQCGGCEEIDTDALPGDSCSECGSGVQTCTRDLDDLVCWRGRSPDNQCGGCDRCILSHAFMDERFDGSYLLNGTTAIVEDIGDNTVHLVFDPLIEGPGTLGLPSANVYLSATDDPLNDGLIMYLSPAFSSVTGGILADPVRTYALPFGVDTTFYKYVVVLDLYLGIISMGELKPGGPFNPDDDDGDAGVDAGGDGGADETVDSGNIDSGMLIDSGSDVIDAGQSSDSGTAIIDSGTHEDIDGGQSADAGPTSTDDAGEVVVDAGTDAGTTAVVDAGAADSGPDTNAEDAGPSTDSGPNFFDSGSDDEAADDAGNVVDSGEIVDGGVSPGEDAGSLDAGDALDSGVDIDALLDAGYCWLDAGLCADGEHCVAIDAGVWGECLLDDAGFGDEFDGGHDDDSGTADAGQNDAGPTDAGDAGATDAGHGDGGESDAGATDGGS